jgi:hypothetical protein
LVSLGLCLDWWNVWDLNVRIISNWEVKREANDHIQCIFIYFLIFHLWYVRAGYGSESEADDEAATVTLSSNIGRVNRASNKSAVRLQEIGPRMTLQLVRIEKGLCTGEVLFDAYGTSSYTFSSSNCTSFSLRKFT